MYKPACTCTEYKLTTDVCITIRKNSVCSYLLEYIALSSCASVFSVDSESGSVIK